MSKRKILAAFKRKGVPVGRVKYMRGCPVPGGYANGWDVELDENVQNLLFDKGFFECCNLNEFDTTNQVLEWVERMPSLNEDYHK